jgi:arylsulfatase
MVRNVVLLSIDALRADHVSRYGYHRSTTPNIDTIADDAFLFESAYSVSSHTREAVPGLLTGRYPDEAVGQDFSLDVDSLATWQQQAGRTTAAFHSNPYVSRAFGFDRDFDTFDDDLHLGTHKLIALAQRALDKLRNRHYARASEINSRSLSWIDSRNEPFFLWNHYMDPHGPYIPVADYRDRFTSHEVSDGEKRRLYKRAIRNPGSITTEERRLLIDLYDAEIRYTDAQIGAFFEALDTRGLLDETAVIVTADHGDAFGEHGYYEHPRHLHEELTQVPLVVVVPDSAAARVETPVSTLDIVPTALELVDSDAELPGRSLLEIAREQPADRVVFAQASGEDDESHLRRFGAWSTRERAFGEYDADIDSSRITEQSDGEIATRLADHMNERIRAGDGGESRDGTDVDDEIEQRLTALGYKE